MMKQRTLYLLALVVMACASCFPTVAQQKPAVIPEVKHFEPYKNAKDRLQFDEKPIQIVYENRDEPYLEEMARTFARDLSDNFGIRATHGKKSLFWWTKPSVVLVVNENLSNNEEYYQLEYDGKKVQIEGASPKGVFWGTRTFLQLLNNEGKIPLGKIKDYPDRQVRGFMLDGGRKYFDIYFLEYYIKLMAYYKMNEFHIHLNDNGFVEFFGNNWGRTYSAFRLESDLYPELTAKDGSYTKEQFKQLQRLAHKYGVNIVPEIDIPAHSLAFTHFRPSLGTMRYGMDHLDLDNPEVYGFCDSLLTEYIAGPDPVFIGPDVHIGTDEYAKEAVEQYRAFTDRYLKLVKKHGKRPRMWGSLKEMKGQTPIDLKGVTINAWNAGWSDPLGSSREGANIITTNDTWLYIVPGADYYHDFLDTKMLYNDWTATMVNENVRFDENNQYLLGAMFAVWNDHVGNGITTYDVHQRALPALITVATKTWNESPTWSYEEFVKLANKQPELPTQRMLGRWTTEDRVVRFNQQFRGRSYRLKGNNYFSLGDYPVGYDYTFEFSIFLEEEQPTDAVLFCDPLTMVMVNSGGEGKVAFHREGKTYRFDAVLTPNEWHRVQIAGNAQGTSLVVDGGEPQVLERELVLSELNKHGGHSKMYIHRTLYLPLVQLGSKRNGAVGEVRDMQLRQQPKVLF